MIARIDLPEDSRSRLMELGLVLGTRIEVLRFAPLGDPVEVSFRGCHLTLRRHEADCILVEPETCTDGQPSTS